MITQARVLEMFDYREGELWWKVRPSNRADMSKPAGVICKRNGYRRVQLDHVNYRAHRLIWFYIHGEFPENQIDHINGNRSDNHIENLRDVTSRENNMNQKKYVNNNSGTTGVCWQKQKEKWYAFINIDGKRKHLGYFTNKDEASVVRKAAEVEYGFHENHGR